MFSQYSNITFSHFWVLGFLLLIPILIIEYFRRHNKMHGSMMLSTTHFLSLKSSRTNFRHTLFILRCVVITLFIIALAGPQKKFSEKQIEKEGIDIILCFDVSGSMLEKDLQPNRLGAAKSVAESFVKTRHGDRIGIVIFSKESFTLCPLTIDYNAILSQINSMESGYLKKEGTLIGTGLATSIDRLRKSKSPTKLVILLTDGLDYGKKSMHVDTSDISVGDAIGLAKNFNVKIYTIGIGTNQGSTSGINAPFLKKIAQETNGQFFLATDNEALKKVYSNIDQLEKIKATGTEYSYAIDLYAPLILAGLILLCIELLLRYSIFRSFP